MPTAQLRDDFDAEGPDGLTDCAGCHKADRLKVPKSSCCRNAHGS